jgi:hypothetical protein
MYIFQVSWPTSKDLVDDHVLNRRKHDGSILKVNWLCPLDSLSLIRGERKDKINPYGGDSISCWKDECFLRKSPEIFRDDIEINVLV